MRGHGAAPLCVRHPWAPAGKSGGGCSRCEIRSEAQLLLCYPESPHGHTYLVRGLPALDVDLPKGHVGLSEALAAEVKARPDAKKALAGASRTQAQG